MPQFALIVTPGSGTLAHPIGLMHKTGRSPPMTAAERQRRCRANGKGRHRGGRLTKAQRDAIREQNRLDLAAAEQAEWAAAQVAPPPTSVADASAVVASSPPTTDWGISAMAA